MSYDKNRFLPRENTPAEIKVKQVLVSLNDPEKIAGWRERRSAPGRNLRIAILALGKGASTLPAEYEIGLGSGGRRDERERVRARITTRAGA